MLGARIDADCLYSCPPFSGQCSFFTSLRGSIGSIFFLPVNFGLSSHVEADPEDSMRRGVINGANGFDIEVQTDILLSIESAH
jgi:hypothetical protein